MVRPLSASGLSALTYAYASAGRAAVPVAPSSYLYSHFRHVSGVLAPKGTRGVSVNRLKILNSLIERLSQVRKDRVLKSEIEIENEAVGGDQIDARIEQLQKEMRSVQEAARFSPYSAKVSVPAGSFVDIAA